MSGNGNKTQNTVAKRITEEERPENGRVDRVKWNFIYEGDRGLALRLQEQEFSHHYGKNREERWVMRENLKEAKVVQTEEEERLQIERMQELERMQQLAKQDEELARQLQEQEQQVISRGTDERQVCGDEVLAKRLEEYERSRMKRYREFRRKQLEQEDMNRAMNSMSLGNGGSDVPSESTSEQNLEEDNFDKDFTDFLSQLPEGLSEDEIKVIQELEDNELAKLLQEAESKRSGARTVAERLKFIRRRAIELRDEQLARIVQQREISRYNERRVKSMTSRLPSSEGASGPDPTALPPFVTQRPHSTNVSSSYSTVIQPPPPKNRDMRDGAVQGHRLPVATQPVATQPSKQHPPPRRHRPVTTAIADSDLYRPNNNAPYQRNESRGIYAASLPVSGPPDRPAGVPLRQTVGPCNPAVNGANDELHDDYLTPDSLLEGNATGGIHANCNANDVADYELPPEMHLELDNSTAATGWSFQQQSRNSVAQMSPDQTAIDRRSSVPIPPPLPLISPGAVPTVQPPAHRSSRASEVRTSSGSVGAKHVSNSHTNGPAPVVTNPMYIVDRPVRSKTKGNSNSDCRPQ